VHTVEAPSSTDGLAELAAGLPIGEVLPEIVDCLKNTPNMVLRAPPGAGKTTVVPLAMLLHGQPWLAAGDRILVRMPGNVRIPKQLSLFILPTQHLAFHRYSCGIAEGVWRPAMLPNRTSAAKAMRPREPFWKRTGGCQATN